jgi:hypothetical protein
MAISEAAEEVTILGRGLVWFDLGDEGGVLEVNEPLLRAPMSLFIVHPPNGSPAESWWETHTGRFVRRAIVGLS